MTRSEEAWGQTMLRSLVRGTVVADTPREVRPRLPAGRPRMRNRRTRAPRAHERAGERHRPLHPRLAARTRHVEHLPGLARRTLRADAAGTGPAVRRGAV